MKSDDIVQLISALVPALAWPAAVVIFFIWFRKPIAAIIERIKKISPSGGIETGSTPSQKSTTEDKKSADELMRGFDSIVLLEQEENIRKELQKYDLSTPEKTESILIKHLASTGLALRFEQINKVIWGSQIKILEKLNSTIDGATKEDLLPYYNMAVEQNPDIISAYSFENYMDYLIRNILVLQDGTHYKITNLGVDFLGYLVNTGQTGYRSY